MGYAPLIDTVRSAVVNEHVDQNLENLWILMDEKSILILHIHYNLFVPAMLTNKICANLINLTIDMSILDSTESEKRWK